jgi:glucokinase
MTVLVADIGGTNTRFALFDTALHCVKKWPTTKYPTLKECVAHYLEDVEKKPEAGCIAVAAPVTDGRTTLTNSNWSGDVSSLPFPTKMINDLQAAGHGVSSLTAADLLTVQQGSSRNGLSVIIGIGTGHGQALLCDEQVFSTEAGHATFAPFDDQTMRLCQWLYRRMDRVRVEDVISGRGIENILNFTKSLFPLEELPTNLPAGVLIDLFSYQSKACREAESLFLRSLGSLCADSILRTKAHRVVLCGGVTCKMRTRIDSFAFWEGFNSKQPMEHIVRGTQIDLAVNERIGLLGAAVVAKSLL